MDCQCSVCTSDSLEKNAVKVVQVKLGYAQVVCKLKTTEDVCCILVCEPGYLVAAEEGGRINLWTMNSQWRLPLSLLLTLDVLATISLLYRSLVALYRSHLVLYLFQCANRQVLFANI